MAIWWSETNNWDLHAVVRGCSLYSTPTTTTSSTDHATAIDPFAPLKEEYSNDVDEREDELDSLSAAAKDVISELEQLCKPPERASTLPEQPQARRTLNNTTPRNKKRKNQQTKKVVCKVPASGVTSDLWAWRKYGQKPIKGSPYPRGYYRCSSSKGCMARKQVERSRTDPSVFVITYSAEHDHPPPTHRNSLAGSTRSKFPAPSSASDGGVSSERCASLANYSSPSVAAGELSPRTPLAEELMGKNVGTERSADLGESRKHSGSSADDSEEEEDEEDFVKSFFSSR